MASHPIYDAYGAPTHVSPQVKTGYTGHVSEADTGWQFLGQRPYSTQHRRFLAPDPLSPFDAGGINRYGYCGGDPINRIDPDGTFFLDLLPQVGVFATRPATPSLMEAVLNATLQAAPSAGRGRNAKWGLSRMRKGEATPSILHLGRDDVPGQPLMFRSPDGQHRVRVLRGAEVESDIPDRIIRDADGKAVRIEPSWKVIEFGNTRAHVADTVVEADEVASRVAYVRGENRESSRRSSIHVVTGTHGKFNANNYNRKGDRVGAAPRFYNEDVKRLAQFADVTVHDVGKSGFKGMSDIFGEVSQTKDIVLGFCYSAVDAYLLNRLGSSNTTVYHLDGSPRPTWLVLRT